MLRIHKTRVLASGPFSGALSQWACKGELNRGLASGWWRAGSSQQPPPPPPLGISDGAPGNSFRNARSPEDPNGGLRHPKWCQIEAKISPKSCWQRSRRVHLSKKSHVENIQLFTMFKPHLPPSRSPTFDGLRPRKLSKNVSHKEMYKKDSQKSKNTRKHTPK